MCDNLAPVIGYPNTLYSMSMVPGFHLSTKWVAGAGSLLRVAYIQFPQEPQG